MSFFQHWGRILKGWRSWSKTLSYIHLLNSVYLFLTPDILKEISRKRKRLHWWVKIYPGQWGKLWLINYSGGCSESLRYSWSGPFLVGQVSRVAFTDFIKLFRFCKPHFSWYFYGIINILELVIQSGLRWDRRCETQKLKLLCGEKMGTPPRSLLHAFSSLGNAYAYWSPWLPTIREYMWLLITLTSIIREYVCILIALASCH